MVSSEIKDNDQSRNLSLLSGVIAGLVGGVFALIVFVVTQLSPGVSLDVPEVIAIWIMLIVMGAIMSLAGAMLMRRLMKPDGRGLTIPSITTVAGGNVVYEKETIKEIVKVPCPYCGTLVENTATKCPSCGAPSKR